MVSEHDPNLSTCDGKSKAKSLASGLWGCASRQRTSVRCWLSELVMLRYLQSRRDEGEKEEMIKHGRKS